MQLLKILYTLLIPFFFVSCNSSIDKTQQSEDSAKSNKTPMLDTLKEIQNKQSLAGKIFFFAPELDKKTCTATGACDCCSSNILFLNDSNFLMVDYCEGSYSYFKGTYRLDNASLKLQFDKLSVNKDYNWKNETDTSGSVKPGYFYKVEKIKSTTEIYQRQQCSEAILFKGNNEYGAPDKGRIFEAELKSIKNDGIWTKLKLK